MTAPPPQPSQQQLALDAATVLATATSVAAATAALASVFAAAGIRAAPLRRALQVVMDRPPDREGFHGPATTATARLNLIRRAQFLVHSARRLAADAGRVSSGERGLLSVIESLQRERRFYGQHQEASWARMRAAAQVDTAVMDHGLLLGWYTVHDARTSPECRAADRHNFRADQMPAIGYPGAVHPRCRCLPGPPIPGAPMVGGATVMPRRRMPQPVPA